MRSIVTMALIIVCGYAMNAQKLSLTPQVGFENSFTKINFNELGSFAPLGGAFSPQVSLRLDYKFKQGFGPYVGVSTSRSIVLYSFNDIENGMSLYNATKGNMQLRMEAGYQFTTNPIVFNKSKYTSQGSTSQKTTANKGFENNYSYRSNCSGSYSSCCRSSCQNKNSQSRRAQSKNNGGWVKLQPSVGVGYIPSPKVDVVTKTLGGQTTYEYRAGNWNTALLTGMGFEFGRNRQRLATVSFNYFKGIGNLNDQVVSTTSGTKTSVAHLQSNTSGFNIKVGIPFTLAEKRTSTKHKNEYRSYKKGGGCERIRIEYRSRCRSL